jgi:patatin-like phospholipase/acyl hydrolase
MKKFRILSLDGGSLRGVISARIMQHLELSLNDFDLISGTSAGSIVGVTFVCGYTPEQIVNMFLEEGKNIFKKRNAVLSKLGLRSKYDIKNLETVLKKYYKDLTIGHIKGTGKDLIIPTFQLNSIDKDSGAKCSMPKIYSSFNKDDHDEPLYSVVCKSSAAPTFFQSYNGYVDGALSGNNNPSINAICSAVHAGYHLDDIEIISIGTGNSDNTFDCDDGGIIQWAPKIIDYMLNGSEENAEFCSKAIVKNFKRIQLRTKSYKFDDPSKIPNMIAEVDKYFGKVL